MRSLLITGASGLLGGNLSFIALEEWDVHGTYLSNRPSMNGPTWHRMDLRDADSVNSVFSKVCPETVVHTAAIADIDECEAKPEEAWQVNCLGTKRVVEACGDFGAKLVHISTSNVFDGEKGDYIESDPRRPINAYSRSKIAAEDEALGLSDSIVARTALVLGFNRTGGRSFLARAVEKLSTGSLGLPGDEIRSPIDVKTLCSGLLELIDLDERGVFHIAGVEYLTRFRIGLKIAEKLDAERSRVEILRRIPDDRAPRPRDASLNTRKARSVLSLRLPNCDEALRRALDFRDG